MQKFEYKVLTKDGEETGIIEASSIKEAVVTLKEKNYKISSIKEASRFSIKNNEFLNKEVPLFEKKVTTKDLSVFSKQLHTMLTAGIPITHCMEVLAEQSDNPKLKVTSHEISQNIRKGNLLSESMKAYPKIFPSLLTNMIEVSELTGNLDSVIDSMAKHYENEAQINSKIRQAMMYPKFLGGIGLLILLGMLTFVVPAFIDMFVQSGTEVPTITAIIIWMSNMVKSRFFLILLFFIGLNYSFKALLRLPKVKLKYQEYILKIPKLGITLKKLISTRFSRTMSTLLKSGIPIVNALEASAKVTENDYLVMKMAFVVEEIKKGNSLSFYLKDMDIFPPILISMISIGEESGDLDGMFDKVADYFDAELDENIKKLISIVEPAMIVIIAIFMGFFIIGMYLPILGMSSTIQY